MCRFCKRIAACIFGLDDIRGYDSIIPEGYVATMRALQPQHMLQFNQISPAKDRPGLESRRLPANAHLRLA